ncbi:hypothetical protein CR983_00935 [Candidatus Saccharibacteria bacterium]|nr:MAG: hypothetical protein CR983_00935 [Candidatus Saccharibacteria bacterium]
MPKTKILLVEDDKSLREIYGVRLLAEGYDIVSAGDGEEALAIAIKERPALIVSDVMMPKISGFDMLDILRSTTETRNIKVIIMTALSSEDQRQRGETLGADRYLVKSQVGIEDVVRTVHEVLADTAEARQKQPTAPAPTQRPAPSPANASQPSASEAMPQPTAPFSTKRPAGLGDRIIHPLNSDVDAAGPDTDMAARMHQELHGESQDQEQTDTKPSSPQPASPPDPSPVAGERPAEGTLAAAQPSDSPQPQSQTPPSTPPVPPAAVPPQPPIGPSPTEKPAPSTPPAAAPPPPVANPSPAEQPVVPPPPPPPTPTDSRQMPPQSPPDVPPLDVPPR